MKPNSWCFKWLVLWLSALILHQGNVLMASSGSQVVTKFAQLVFSGEVGCLDQDTESEHQHSPGEQLPSTVPVSSEPGSEEDARELENETEQYVQAQVDIYTFLAKSTWDELCFSGFRMPLLSVGTPPPEKV